MNSTSEVTSTVSEDVGVVTTEPPQFYWMIALVLGLGAMTGNGLIILVNILKKVSRNSTNVIITNLAVVDFRESLRYFLI